jgi:hypothetical protein
VSVSFAFPVGRPLLALSPYSSYFLVSLRASIPVPTSSLFPLSSQSSLCHIYISNANPKRTQYIKTINAFAKYDNVLGYNVGNEVLTANFTNAAPFLKAAARDVRAYL